MAKNETPIFTVSGINDHASISVANPNLDGSGTIVSIADGGTDLRRFDQIEIKANAATTAGMVRLFLSINGGGTWFLWREVLVDAITPGPNVEAFSAIINLTTALNDPPLMLEGVNNLVGAAPENAETFDVWVRGGDFAI